MSPEDMRTVVAEALEAAGAFAETAAWDNVVTVNVALAEGVTPAEAEARIKRLLGDHIDGDA